MINGGFLKHVTKWWLNLYFDLNASHFVYEENERNFLPNNDISPSVNVINEYSYF